VMLSVTGVFDLNSRIDLEEVESLLLFADEEFECSKREVLYLRNQ